ncbi:hypothetical protein C8Q74DRAFT_1267560 [Fomes fomentarius]|nr:hypothetical protein C8Q74DRAFT_1267560 [Fomes fomentarius]
MTSALPFSTLSSTNLRKLDAAKQDKTSFLRTYIRSQEGHLSNYAREGKSVAASWALSSGDDPGPSRTKKRPHDLESGLGTPLLKPRAEVRPAEEPKVELSRVYRDKASPSGREQDNCHKFSSSRLAKENVAARRRRDDDESSAMEAGRHPKRLRQPDTEAFTRPLPSAKEKATPSKNKHKPTQRRVEAKPRRDDATDEEHQNILAERRDRRRAKKAIFDSNPVPPDSESSGGSEHKSRSPSAKGARKKGKKDKALKLPAGMALMHGFSAQNIGRNRLTLQYDTIGFFSKGKASAKTAVKRVKNTTSQLKMFSEERFLSKSKAAKENKPRSLTNNASDSEDVLDLESEKGSSPLNATRHRTAPFKPSKRKRQRSPSPVPTSPDTQEEAESQVSCPPLQKDHPEREPSPLWDIEVEDGKLPSGSDASAPSVQSARATHLAGTLLLDTRAFTAKWAVPKGDAVQHDPEDVDETAFHIDLHAVERSDSPSIGPSRSASQVALRQQEVDLAARMRNITSKYFSATADASRTTPFRSSGREEISHLSGADPADANANSSKSLGPQEAAPEDCIQEAMATTNDLLVAPSPVLASGFHLVTQHAISSGQAVCHASSRPTSSAIACPASPSSSLNLPMGPVSPASPDRSLQLPLDHDLGAGMTRHVSLKQDLQNTDLSDSAGYEETRQLLEDTLKTLEAGPVPRFLSDVSPFVGSFVHPVDAFIEEEGEMAVDGNPMQFSPDADEVGGEPLEDFESTYFPDQEEADWGVYEHPIEEYALSLTSPDSLEEQYLAYAAEADRADEYFSASTMIVERLDWADGDEVDNETNGLQHVAFAEPEDPGHFDVASSADLDADVEMEDGSDEDPSVSVLGSLQRFSQGRALLMGISEVGTSSGRGWTGVSKVEEAVARSLGDHWRPQRF